MKDVVLKDNVTQQLGWERFNLQPQILRRMQEYRISPEIWSALKDSIFPGAKDESILMAIDYCRAKNLDVMMRVVHIVNMPVNKVYRDVIMPGIGLSRVQAARSGRYIGVSEPEFGPDVEDKFGTVKITYPKWCKVTVKAIVQGHIAEFTSKRLWLELYGMKDKLTGEPNSQWRKMPYAMLAKCAESQALQMAFPELVSQQPTFEEMMGKSYEDFDGEIKNITPKAQSLSSRLDKVLDAQASKVESVSNPPEEAAPEEVPIICEEINKTLAELVRKYNIPDEKVHLWCQAAEIDMLDQIDKEKAEALIKQIEKKYANKEE